MFTFARLFPFPTTSMLIKKLQQYVDAFVARNEYKQFKITRRNWMYEVWVSDNPPIEHIDLRIALIEILSRLKQPTFSHLADS